MKYLVKIQKRSEIECKFKEHTEELNNAVKHYNNKHRNRELTLVDINDTSFIIKLINKENFSQKLSLNGLRNFSNYLFNECNWKEYSSVSNRLFTYEEIIENNQIDSIEEMENEKHYKISQVSIKRFKGLKDISFKLSEVNLLIGANNSGKSSILQGVHFGISCLQSYGNVSKGKFNASTNITYDELYYKPIDEVRRLGYKGGLGRGNKNIEIQYHSDENEVCQIKIESGKSRGNSLTLHPNGDKLLIRRLSDTSRSFSYYVTGLAGISSSEEKRGASIVKELAVKGSSNSVFRNIVYMLKENDIKWKAFTEYFKNIFPGINIYAKYNESEDKEIKIEAEIKGIRYPIDSMGTSVLQIIQMLSYILLFEPKLIILDEPDAHLHPNNQKKIIELLIGLAKKENMQIIISTHSKHIVDLLMPTANVIWVSEGELVNIESNEKSYISLMSEIGALEKGALLGGKKIRCCVLTEDDDQQFLKVLLESNDFNMEETDIWSYKGCTNIHIANAITNFMTERYDNLNILIHIDRDIMPVEDVVAKRLEYENYGISCLITRGSDIEAYFVNEEHIKKLYPNLTMLEIQGFINGAVAEMKDKALKYIVDSRDVYYKRKAKNDKDKIPSAGSITIEALRDYDASPRSMTKGKDLLHRVCGKIQTEIKHNPEILVPTEFLRIPEIIDISNKIWNTEEDSTEVIA